LVWPPAPSLYGPPVNRLCRCRRLTRHHQRRLLQQLEPNRRNLQRHRSWSLRQDWLPKSRATGLRYDRRKDVRWIDPRQSSPILPQHSGPSLNPPGALGRLRKEYRTWWAPPRQAGLGHADPWRSNRALQARECPSMGVGSGQRHWCSRTWPLAPIPSASRPTVIRRGPGPLASSRINAAA
jgi:hypothetical protein